ncbi:MAG: cupin domain-containing protein [SAR324 cluster bacterium]|nr:cupin domain-containing protein [SAR324 cluster bacterium]
MERYILSKKEIEEFEGIKKTHYLNSNAQRVNKSLGDLTGLTGFGFHIVEIEPNFESTEYHVHHFEDECVYILEGEATVTIGKDKYKVYPGDFIGYRAGGKAHTMYNDGKQTLRCIVVGQRLAHDVGDYPNLNKRLYRNEGMDWDMVDMEALSHPNAGKKV